MFREMNRKNQALTEEECIRILTEELRGVLSVNGDDGYPYGSPIDHYYHAGDGKIYFHSAKFGHRVDAMKADPRASFCVHDSGFRREGGNQGEGCQQEDAAHKRITSSGTQPCAGGSPWPCRWCQSR